jgi:NADH:ubiquinone oxidoreductase subunit K
MAIQLIINSLWIILRALLRTLSENFGNDFRLLIYAHQYRYGVQSIFDLVNGLAILYIIYRVVETVQIKKNTNISQELFTENINRLENQEQESD